MFRRSEWFHRAPIYVGVAAVLTMCPARGPGNITGLSQVPGVWPWKQTGYLKASSPGSTAESLCWLLPVAARCWLPLSLSYHLTSQTSCSVAGSGCEKGQGQCSGKWCLDPWCHQNFNVCWQGPQCSDKTSWFGISLCFTGLLARKALAGQAQWFSWLLRDGAQLPFLLSHTIFPK